MAIYDPHAIVKPETKVYEKDKSNQYIIWVMTRSYISKIDGAVSGQARHSKTFCVACKVRDRLKGLLSPEECLPIMQEYNQRCEPPWSDEELLHKLVSAWGTP